MPSAEIVFAGTGDAVPLLAQWSADPRPGILLTGDLATMAALHAAEPVLVHRINLGGIHHRPDREEKLRYLYLAGDEEALLRRLQAAGAEISAQDLPTTPPVALDALL